MRQPQLIDIVDEAWAQDKLSDDGTYFFQFFSSIDSNERRAEIVVSNELDNGNEDSDIDSRTYILHTHTHTQNDDIHIHTYIHSW